MFTIKILSRERWQKCIKIALYFICRHIVIPFTTLLNFCLCRLNRAADGDFTLVISEMSISLEDRRSGRNRKLNITQLAT